MRIKAIEYPHPVLNDYSNDFIDSGFSIDVVSHSDNGNEIVVEFAYNLESDGVIDLLSRGVAKIVMRITCPRTSYRETRSINLSGTTVISINKKFLADYVDMQAIIVASESFDNYVLKEFNKDYFEGASFSLRKGDIIANEPGMRIKLDTVLEKNMAGIVTITSDPSLQEMRATYSSLEDADEKQYIYITLPETEYKNYAKVMAKKHLKNGVERFLQSAVVLPAITEAVSLLKEQEMIAEDDLEEHYKGTIWADSMIEALSRLGIDLATTVQSSYEIANKLLGNVTFDAISNLMQKMTEWSTIGQEDEVL